MDGWARDEMEVTVPSASSETDQRFEQRANGEASPFSSRPSYQLALGGWGAPVGGWFDEGGNLFLIPSHDTTGLLGSLPFLRGP